MENHISIPNPCSKNWNAMSPNKNGRFCISCDKTVIDFTKMEKPEILKYFSENSNNESICGHFKLNQIETKERIQYDNLKNRLSRIKIKPIKVIAMFSLSLVFTLTSCMGKAAVDGEPAIRSNDTINENEISNKEQNVAIKKDSIKSDMNQIRKKK